MLPEHDLAVVCDGMGGHEAGEVASGIGVDTIKRFFEIAKDPNATWPYRYDKKMDEAGNLLAVSVQWAESKDPRDGRVGSPQERDGHHVCWRAPARLAGHVRLVWRFARLSLAARRIARGHQRSLADQRADQDRPSHRRRDRQLPAQEHHHPRARHGRLGGDRSQRLRSGAGRHLPRLLRRPHRDGHRSADRADPRRGAGSAEGERQADRRGERERRHRQHHGRPRALQRRRRAGRRGRSSRGRSLLS